MSLIHRLYTSNAVEAMLAEQCLTPYVSNGYQYFAQIERCLMNRCIALKATHFECNLINAYFTVLNMYMVPFTWPIINGAYYAS